MKRQKAELSRELYKFPEGKIRLINWKEVVPMELGNWFHDPHCHLYAEEFIYCLNGKAVAGGGDREYLFTPGDVQFAAVSEIHWLRNPFDEPLEFLWVYTGVAMPDESGYTTPDLFDEAYTIVKKNKIPK